MGERKSENHIFSEKFPLITQIILSLTILFISILALSPAKRVYCNPHTEIDVDTAHNMITSGNYPNLIILDVRSGSLYAEGHIENAINIPVTELEARIDELLQYNDTEIIVYCETGILGPQAADILDSYDFTKVFNISGGFIGWESAGYPVIPELSSLIMLSLFLIISSSVIILRKRTKNKSML